MGQVCIMSSWFFNVYMNAVMKGIENGNRRKGVRFQEDGKEWRLLGLLYADDLFFVGSLRAIVGCFIEVCRRKGLKVNEGKSKVMFLGGERG